MRAKDKLASARLMACERMPYFRTVIMSLMPKKVTGFGTFGVTKTGILLWDSICLDRWTVKETAAVLVHEISHLLRGHSDRCERIKADPQLWNIAGDLEINDNLLAAKLLLPKGGIFPEKMGFKENLLAEEYYRELEKISKFQIAMACGAPQDEASNSGDDDKNDGQNDNKKGFNMQIGQGVGRGRCGGCAGNPEDGEEQLAGNSGRSTVEMERIKRTVAEDIRREAERRQGRGTVPGSWVRWANQQLKPPQIPWRKKLARAVRGAIAYRPGAVDYHYTRPSRRQAGIGFGTGRPILPALRAPIPRVSVIIDTSGSMGDEELMEAVSETKGILNATGASATFCACDAKVQHIQKVRHWKDVMKLMQGGGGTDFRPPIEAMIQERPRPDVVVFITDGQGPAPTIAPPFRMIWVLVGNHCCKPYANSYGNDHIKYGEFIEILRNDETFKLMT